MGRLDVQHGPAFYLRVVGLICCQLNLLSFIICNNFCNVSSYLNRYNTIIKIMLVYVLYNVAYNKIKASYFLYISVVCLIKY